MPLTICRGMGGRVAVYAPEAYCWGTKMKGVVSDLVTYNWGKEVKGLFLNWLPSAWELGLGVSSTNCSLSTRGILYRDVSLDLVAFFSVSGCDEPVEMWLLEPLAILILGSPNLTFLVVPFCTLISDAPCFDFFSTDLGSLVGRFLGLLGFYRLEGAEK